MKSLSRSLMIVGSCAGALLTLFCGRADAVTPYPDEMAKAGNWVAQHIGASGSVPAANQLPFSFKYGPVGSEADSTTFLDSWTKSETISNPTSTIIRHTLTWDEPGTSTGLEFRAIADEYTDSPAVYWHLEFYNRNSGASTTNHISALQTCKTTFSAGQAGPWIVRTANGSNGVTADFQPMTYILSGSGAATPTFGTATGYSTDQASNSSACWPYYNLESPSGGGIMAAIGWSGDWTAACTLQNAGTSAPIIAMNAYAPSSADVDTFLYSSETLTSGSQLLLWYDGSWLRGHNLQRRFIQAHVLPTTASNLPTAEQVNPNFNDASATVLNNLKDFLGTGSDYMSANAMNFDTVWMDAGWNGTAAFTGNFEDQAGTWTPYSSVWPNVGSLNGIQDFSNYVHNTAHKRFSLWFEPEVIHTGSYFYNNVPSTYMIPPYSGCPSPALYIANFAYPPSLSYYEGQFDSYIKPVANGGYGLDILRVDSNLTPYGTKIGLYWSYDDPAGRNGATQLNYINGWYSFLDHETTTGRAYNSNFFVDLSSAGGRRIDIGALHHGIPMLRSDDPFYDTDEQSQEYSLSLWLPLNGQGESLGLPSTQQNDFSKFHFRSGQASQTMTVGVWTTSTPWAALYARLNEYPSFKQYYSGDFYPQTATGVDARDWQAWQYDLPEKGTGMLQTFRRQNAVTTSTQVYHLAGLDPSANYVVTNFDTGGASTYSGDTLMASGFTATNPAYADGSGTDDDNSAAIYTYVKSTLANGAYWLQNIAYKNNLLQLKADATGANVDIESIWGGTNREWKFTRNADGTYYIQDWINSHYLTGATASPYVKEVATATAYSKWTLLPADGGWMIKNYQIGKVIDPGTSAAVSGQTLSLTAVAGTGIATAQQSWSIRSSSLPTSSNGYTTTNVWSNLEVGNANGAANTSPGAYIVQYPDVGGGQQTWYYNQSVAGTANGIFTIHNDYPGLYLDATGVASNNPVNQSASGNNWIVPPGTAGPDSWLLMDNDNGLVLSDNGASLSWNANLYMNPLTTFLPWTSFLTNVNTFLAQQYTIRRNGPGVNTPSSTNFTLRSAYDRMRLSMDTSSSAVQTESDFGTSQQLWAFYRTNNAAIYTIKNTYNGQWLYGPTTAGSAPTFTSIDPASSGDMRGQWFVLPGTDGPTSWIVRNWGTGYQLEENSGNASTAPPYAVDVNTGYIGPGINQSPLTQQWLIE